jgi:CO/xanthine dehydrogenase Mo-binding subunit
MVNTSEQGRVIQATTGGGFGGRSIFPSAFGCLGAFVTGRPVKWSGPGKNLFAPVQARLLLELSVGAARQGRLTAAYSRVIRNRAYASLDQPSSRAQPLA